MLLSLTAPAIAQESDTTEVDRWMVSAELSYTDQSGNETLRLLTAGLNLSHLQQERYELDVALQSRYGEGEDRVIARNYYGSAAFDFRPEARWSPFLFADAEHDRFKRLDLRFSSGGGAKYTFYRPADEESKASVSLALLYSYENLSSTPEFPPVDPTHSARWSLRAKGNQLLRPGVTLTHVSFFQPVVDEVADYLLRTETGIKASLTDRLALSVVYQTSRDNRAPPGVAADDRVFKTGVIIDF